MQNILKCGVIGTGYLGRFHAQKYKQLPNLQLVGVFDQNLNTSKNVAAELQVQCFKNINALLDNVEALSIVVSTKKHFEVAKQCILAKKHVLLEKPMTETLSEADELIKLANANNVILQIGHLERFNPVFNALNTLKLCPKSIDCKRLAPFNQRGSDVDVILDVMIHDLDWILQIMQQPVIAIDAKGSAVMTPQTDIAHVRLTFANGNIANLTASRIHQNAERSALIIDENQYIQADFLNKNLQFFKKSNLEIFPGVADLEKNLVTFDTQDALLDEIIAFTSAIHNSTAPIVTAIEGRNVLKLALDISTIIEKQKLQHEAL
jgi:predicted dehydrogenase